MCNVFSVMAAVLLCVSCSFIKVNGQGADAPISTFSDVSNEFDQSVKNGSIVAGKNFISRDFTVEEFTEISCNIPSDIYYSIGPASLSISAPDNVMDHIKVSVRNGKLDIRFDIKNVRRANDIKVVVSSSALSALEINGAGDFYSNDALVSDDFTINANGASDISISSLEANEVSVNVNGAGDVDFDMLKAVEASICINGAGDADIEKLDCGFVKVEVNGAGDCSLDGRADKASLAIHGVGNIDIEDLACTDVNSSVQGIGRVER